MNWNGETQLKAVIKLYRLVFDQEQIKLGRNSCLEGRRMINPHNLQLN